jgi:hypothetical protein
MKPIYFPFTYASDRVLAAMAACFGRFVIYQPLIDNLPSDMQVWQQKGILDVRIPVVEKEKELKAAVKNYLNWADIHSSGNGTGLITWNTLQGSTGFWDHLSPAYIAADIKQKSRGGSTARVSDLLMAARIFLYFAQQFDSQSQEAEHDLKHYGQKAADLIRELKMEDDILVEELYKEPVQLPDNSADYLLADRLEAWTRIFLKDTESSGLFVTHSAAMLDHLLDTSPTAERLFHLHSIPLGVEITENRDAWHLSLLSKLAHLAENCQPVSAIGPEDAPAIPVSGNTVSLCLYLVPDQRPADFFSRCAEVKQDDGDARNRADRFKKTLIGLIEF